LLYWKLGVFFVRLITLHDLSFFLFLGLKPISSFHKHPCMAIHQAQLWWIHNLLIGTTCINGGERNSTQLHSHLSHSACHYKLLPRQLSLALCSSSQLALLCSYIWCLFIVENGGKHIPFSSMISPKKSPQILPWFAAMILALC